MQRGDILDVLHRRPFRPFQLTLTDGRTYDIRHPELVLVGASAIFVGFPTPETDEAVFERFALLDLSHVMQITPLEPSASSNVWLKMNGATWRHHRVAAWLFTSRYTAHTTPAPGRCPLCP